MYVIKVKDRNLILKYARKYKSLPMELIIYTSDPQMLGGLLKARKDVVDVMKLF